jgi:regulatory protein YycI of two-component signal transduction system YycFG
MHAQHPKIAKKWDKEMQSLPGPRVNKVYKTGSPVAHKNMTLDPTGYINREVNKGNKVQPSTRRSGLAKMSLRRAAMRRQQAQKRAPKGRKG